MSEEPRDGRPEGAAPESGAPRDGMTRRRALAVLAAAPVAAALPEAPPGAAGPPAVLPPEVERAARAAEEALARGQYQPKFLRPREWRTVRVLADLVIPRDERSGSASDAGVPEFIDFTLHDRPAMRVPFRGGLAWLDAESRRRFGAAFADATPARQAAILDDIAWPARARPEMSHGVAFFSRFRDLAASGFYTSRIGMADLAYMGNAVVPVWRGCPEPALRKLEVSYGAMDAPPGEAG